MSATADGAATSGMPGTSGQVAGSHDPVDRFGLSPSTVVQELGWDDDCDQAFRDAVANRITGDLVDEDYQDVVDVVILWWREGDGDLVDALVDALTTLADSGVIWLLTPKAAREGHVEPSDINDAAPTAGLAQTSSISACRDWNGARLASPRAARKTR